MRNIHRHLGAMALSLVFTVSHADESAQDVLDTDPARSTKSRLLSGEQAFAACAGCHSIEAGANHKVGPNLFGILDRPAAQAKDYAYSPALSSAKLRWTREALFAWIASSEALVPDSWMLYYNMLEPEELMRLIDYLAQTATQD